MVNGETTAGLPRVTWREEEKSPPPETTVLRLEVADLNRAINMSLNWWTAYAAVLEHLGRSGHGALVLSVFTVTEDCR